MTSLIACISSGKGTWAHVSKLIKEGEWDSIFLVTNDFGVKNFEPEKQVEYVIVDSNKYLQELTEDIMKQLKGKISDTEVGLNLISGEGKEHMAILSAVLNPIPKISRARR